MAAYIPVVDFASFNSFHGEDLSESNVEIKRLSQEIYEAFTTAGFVYIKNHGIPESKISELFEVGKKFFKLPFEEKNLLARKKNHGYVAVGVEKTDPSKPVDSKEAFNITEAFNGDTLWPSGDCADFKPTVQSFFKTCEELTLRILDLMALGLKLEDKHYLRKTHTKIGEDGNKTTLRLLYYPVMNGLKPGQIRLGEHSDYGTITLLFQDQIGGLEVLSKKDGFVPARPIEGTILVNIGDLLQRWTNDKLVSTRHRVVVPENEQLLLRARQSVAFFVHPDDNVVIECLDGSGHYPAITSDEYLQQRLRATYI